MSFRFPKMVRKLIDSSLVFYFLCYKKDTRNETARDLKSHHIVILNLLFHVTTKAIILTELLSVKGSKLLVYGD